MTSIGGLNPLLSKPVYQIGKPNASLVVPNMVPSLKPPVLQPSPVFAHEPVHQEAHSFQVVDDENSFPKVQDLVNSLKQLEDKKKVNDSKVKTYKLELKYQEVTDKIKLLKEQLYIAMKEEGIDEYDKYNIQNLAPTDVKRGNKLEEKKKVIKEVLSSEIGDQHKIVSVTQKLLEKKI
jgi:hypothetical protein